MPSVATLDELTSTFLVTQDASGLPKQYDASKITPLIDGDAYNTDLAAVLDQLGKGTPAQNAAEQQFILIHNWWLGLDATEFDTGDGHGGAIFKQDSFYTTDGPLRLKDPPPGTVGGAAKLLDLIIQKAQAGVDVRVMGWITSGMTEGALNAYVARRINQVNASTLRSIELLRPALGLKAITNEIAHTAGSSHLKMVIAGNKTNAVGYTGGIDFQLSRWAQIFHPDYHTPNDPNPAGELWHDVMAKVEGPAVAGLYEWYSTIWKEVTSRQPVTYKLLRRSGTSTIATSVVSHSMDRTNVGSPDVAAFPVQPNVPAAGSHRVQSVRTSPQANFAQEVPGVAYSKPLSYAPQGIFEFQAGIQKAISGASSYIYLEDQYLYSIDIMGYIHDRVKQTPQLKVILMTGGADPHDERQPLGYLAKAMDALLKGVGGADPLSAEAAKQVRLYLRLTEIDLGAGKIDKATVVAPGKYQLTFSAVPPGLVRGAPYPVNEAADTERMQVRIGSNVFPVVENPAIPQGGPFVLVVQPGAFDIFTLDFPQDGQDFELFVMRALTVHAKTTLIDDRCAIVGSANAQRRSLFTDIEHSVVYIDTGDAIRDYRTALWSDHFRHAPAADFNDITQALASWNSLWAPSSTPITAPRRPPHIIQVALPIIAPKLEDSDLLKYEAISEVDSRARWGGMGNIQRLAALDGTAIGSGGGTGGGSTGSNTVKIVTVKVVRLAFRSDHALLLDNNADLTASGAPIAKPEWVFGQPSKPITHTKSQPVSVEIDLQVFPPDASPVFCDVVGHAPFAGLEFRVQQELRGGEFKIKLTSTTSLPNQIAVLTGNINWEVDTHSDVGVLSAGSSFGHTVYLTFGKPIDPPRLESGITQKRVETAIGQVQATSTLVTDDIIKSIMTNVFPTYALNDDPALKSVDHPRYFNSIGGAWRIAEHIAQTAQCQAIVRFVRACLLVLGASGTFKAAIVFADPDTGDALEDDQELGGVGLTGATRTFNGKSVSAVLLDKDPGPVGSVFEIGASGAPGINFYEACLKFSDTKPAKYYAGGAGGAAFDNIDQVIHVFSVLAWLSDLPPVGPGHSPRVRVERIVRRY